MTAITITEYPATYELSEDNEFLCTHDEYEIEPPCCSGIDSEGNPSCGCHGGYSIICYNYDCTGITEHEAELILDTYHGGFDDGY